MYAKPLDPQVPQLIRGLNILSILEIFMTVVVGQDTAKTRRTLNMCSKSIAYYSIPAAQAACLGDFSRLPAALKVGTLSVSRQSICAAMRRIYVSSCII